MSDVTRNQRRWPRLWLALGLLLAIAVGQRTSVAEVAASPLALETPTEVVCRPHEGKPDQVRVEWKDANGGAAEYVVYRQQVGNNTWNELGVVTEPNSNGEWGLVAANASNTTVYRYTVTARDEDEETGKGLAGSTCREPLNLLSDQGNYRIFYRLQECPDYEGKPVCTENVNLDGKNKHAAQVLGTSEAYRSTFMSYSFDDPAVFNDAKPFPLDFFPCNNGCANGDGVQYPPAQFEKADYDPATGTGHDYKVFIAGHEIFHKVQGVYGGGGADPYYKWLIEGQARAMEDKSCIFDNAAHCTVWDTVAPKYWLGQAKAYLGKPEFGLLEQSYNAGLFWAYVMEQFGSVKVSPQYGVDFLVDYWEQNRENMNDGNAKDGIGTLNDTLQKKIGTSKRFKDIFQDFAVANYAKDYITEPAPAALEKYYYVDEKKCPTCGYGPVKRTVAQALAVDGSIFGLSGMDAWGARYFEIDPHPSIPVVNIEVNTLPGTPYTLYYHVLALKNGAIANQWSHTGKNFNLSVYNIDPVYDRIALIVASHDHQTNFEYGFNLTDGLYLLAPTDQFPAQAGEFASPKKFTIQLQVMGKDNKPVAGINPNDFVITVGNKTIHPPANEEDSALVASTYLGGQYWLVVRAPSDPGCTQCDLTVAYTEYSDTMPNAVVYGPQPSVDNMLIIDRSGSMLGGKIAAAKSAAKVYIDSYDTGDRMGIISYNDQTTTEFDLTGWTATTRQQAHDSIDNMADPDGLTANGKGLRDGMQKLIDQASPNPAWAMVLLSDGEDTVADENDHIPAFVNEYNARKKAKDQVPVIHVVAVGDDADGVALERVTQASGGLFQWLPDTNSVMAAAVGAPAQTPLPLELAEVYRVFAESVTNEQQVYAATDVIDSAQSKTHLVQVDSGASEAIFTIALEYEGFGIPTNVRIFRPDNTQLGPPTLSANRHLFWRVPAPQGGQWRVEVSPIIPGAVASAAPSGDVPSRTLFLVEAAVKSDLAMQVFLGLPPDERLAGKPMPLLVLLADVAPLTGATVTARVERTGEQRTLFDSGQHGDGAANDGFYGGLLKNTNQAGGYTVIVDAEGVSPLNGPYTRRARVSFFMGQAPDRDNDGLPDWWEEQYPCMDPDTPDRDKDPDNDGLINAGEFAHKTNPCDPDTDGGGESDGSEVARGADPLVPDDDNARPPRPNVWPGVGRVFLRLTLDEGETHVDILRAPTREGPFTLHVADLELPDGRYEDTDVTNGERYCYRVVTKGRADSVPSDVICATPSRDPHPPHGEVALSWPPLEPAPRTVTLLIDASDDPAQEEHMPYDGEFLTRNAEQSGVVEMMVSNRADFLDAEWEPYGESKEWTFEPDDRGIGTVFLLFRDAAGNVSDVVALSVPISDDAQPSMQLFLPVVQR